MATDNKSLGKFILDGIPPAPRGVPQIEVTFDIDANGILKVTAQDKATNRSQHITITASSGLTEAEIERMQREAEANKEKDLKQKELVEARNYADNTAYTVEKTLKDLGDKVPEDLKKQAEEGVAKLNGLKTSDDSEAIRREADAVGQLLQKIGASAYTEGGPTAGPGGEPGGPGGPTQEPGDGKPGGDENVVDGEFHNA